MAVEYTSPPLSEKDVSDFVWKRWFEKVHLRLVDLNNGILSGVIPVANGGTGLSSYTTGDILAASNATTLSKVGIGVAHRVLTSLGAGNLPAWGQVVLSTMVSGTLPIANGGTGQITANAALNALLPAQTSATGKVLQSDGTNTGWAAGHPPGCYVFNGDFSTWQMGTGGTLAASTGHTHADLWSYSSGVNFAQYSITRIAGFSGGAQYGLRYQRGNGNTDTNVQYLIHDMESLNSYAYRGKQVTLSFWARCGANYSATSSILVASVLTGTGTDQARRSGAYTGQVATSENKTLTTSWQQFSVTASLDTNITQIGLMFNWTPTGTAGVNDWVEITMAQFDDGQLKRDVADIPFHVNLEACQRRLFKTFPMATAPAQNTGSATGCYRGTAVAAGAVTYRGPFFPFPTRMRVAPTLTTYSPTAASAEFADTTAGLACTNVGTGPAEEGTLLTCTQNAGTAIGDSLSVHFVADARI